MIKANALVAVIKKSFAKITKLFVTFYIPLVRPHLEYANQVWRPRLKKLIIMIDNVQKRATRLVERLRTLTYEERLRVLRIPTLEYRRQRGHAIKIFKILSGAYDPVASEGLLIINETL